MSPLVVFAVLVGSALAVPQVAIKPVAFHRYQPLALSTPVHAQYTPYHHPAPAYKPYYTAAQVIPSVPYNVKPVQPYTAPAYTHPTPAFNHVAQPYYNSQYAKPVAILRSTHDDNFDGSFTYDFEAENGISSQASGYVKAISPEERAQVMQGQYAYTAPDGTPIITRWYADETGFHAEGAHLPVAPASPFKTA